MDRETDTFSALYDDEAVCFIADRYHITSQELLHRFSVQDSAGFGAKEEDLAFRLEDNEIEIIRGLIESITSKIRI